MARYTRSPLSVVAVVAVMLTVFFAGDLRQAVSAAVKYTLVRDVDNPAAYPFQGGLDTFGGGLAVPTTTPDGSPVKRLVVEHVSGYCNAQGTTTIWEVSLGVQQGNGNASHFIVPTPTYTDPGVQQLSTFSQPVRLYADPGTTMTVGYGQANGANLSCTLIVSGHLVTQ